MARPKIYGSILVAALLLTLPLASGFSWPFFPDVPTANSRPAVAPREAGPDPAFLDALWVGTSGDLLKLALGDGSSLLGQSDAAASLAVAVDEDEERVWTWSAGGTLQALAFDGTVQVSASFPDHAEDSPVHLAAGRGFAWLAFADVVYQVDGEGEVLATIPVTRGLRAVAFDPSLPGVWIANLRELSAFDLDATPLTSLDLGKSIRIVDLAVDRADGGLWVALADAVRRYDAALELLFEAPFDQVRAVALPGAGAAGAWVGLHREVLLLGPDGTVQAGATLPVGGGSANLITVAADPTGAAAWALSGDFLFQIDPAGQIVRTLRLRDFGPGTRGNDLAAWADVLAPLITFTAPVDGAVLNLTRPTLELAWSDRGIGVDPASLLIEANGSAVAVSCEATAAGASCTPDAPLAAGAVTFSATVADFAGNRSAAAEVTVTIALDVDLLPLTDQTLVLGSSLEVPLEVVGGLGLPLSFSAAPLPLPAGASLDALAGTFSFQPVAAGVHTLTFSVTDGLSADSESLTITVLAPAPGTPTSVRGRVLDTTDGVAGVETPIVGARVSLLGSGVVAFTDAAGAFELLNVPGEDQVIDFDTRSALPAPDGSAYAGFREKIFLQPGTTNVIARPFYLPRIDPSSLTTVNPVNTTVVHNPNLDATVTVPPSTARDETGTLFVGQLSLSEVPSSLAPVALPEELEPGLLLTLQPVGVTFSQPIPLTLPNLDGMPPGAELDLWSVDPTTGEFSIVGVGRVSADGTMVETISGGIRAASWHAFMGPQPGADGSDNNDDNQDQDRCDDCNAGSSTALLNGNLSITHDLPAWFSLDRPRSLRLVYNSGSADPRPVVSSRTTIPVRAAVPPTVSASLEIGGVALGPQVSTRTAGLSENRDETFRQAVQADARVLETGSYPYRMKLTSHYSSSAISSFQRGELLVHNQRQSPFGAGWGLSGLGSLREQGDGSLILADGNGSIRRFRPSSFNVAFPNFGDLSTFARNGTTAAIANPILVGGVPVLRLTNSFNQRGSAFYTTPIVIAADGQPVSFSSHFQFRISNNRNSGADGLTFIATNSPNRLGGAGVGIGYSGINPSLVVEFDTWNNGGIDGGSGNQVGINLNGNLNSVVRYIPPTSLESGAVKYVWIDYDGPARRLEVRLADSPARPASPQLSYPVDLPALLGRSDAYFGFTSGTGAAAADHDILSWTFSSTSGTSAFLSPAGDFSTLERDPSGGYLRTFKNGSAHRYDAAGRLVAAVDVTGDTTTYSYDGAGRLIAVTDPVGQQATLTYSGGLLAAITDPSGRSTFFEHDGSGNLVRIIDPSGTARGFTYDGEHHLTSQVSKRGFATTYHYNAAGQNDRVVRPDGSVRTLVPKTSVGLFPAGTTGAPVVRPEEATARYVDGRGNAVVHDTDRFGSSVRTVDPSGRVTEAERDENGNPTRILNSNGSVHEITYDDRGNLLSLRQTGSGGAGTEEMSFTYEPSHNRVTAVRDPAGNTLTIEYDAAGNPTRITDPLGGTATSTYNSRGQRLTATDALGRTARFTYDALGNLATTTDALGVVTRYTRDALGRVTALTEAVGLPEERTRTFAYDDLNRTVEATDPEGNTLRYTYDESGNPIAVTTPTGQVIRTTFDNLNRPVRVDDPIRGVTRYSYDTSGNITEVIDARGSRTRIEYDGQNRPVRTVDAVGGEQLFSFDPRGNLLSYENALGQTWSFTYDGLDRLTAQTDPLGHRSTFTYDGRNFLTTATDAKGQVAHYTYDALGRLLTFQTADNTTRRGFDAAGNLVSVEDDDSRLLFTHDALNRPVSIEVVDVGVQPGVTLTSTFDALSRRLRLADSLGGTTDYRYDINGRLTGLTTPAGQPIGLSYDAASRLTAVSLPNSLTVDYTYDTAGRLSSLEYQDGGGGALARFDYFHDVLGKLIRIAEGSRVRDFSYDGLERLVSGGTSGLPETYDYDAIGNRISSFLSSAYRYDGANRLLEDDTFLYAYDILGNLVGKTDKATGGHTGYTWDAVGQLVAIDLPDGTTATFRYDAFGRRIEKAHDGTVSRYIYDGAAILLEFDGSNTLAARYSHGPGVDQPLAMERGGESYYYLTDHQGSIRFLTDSTGAAVNRYEYDSFGRLLVREETVENPYAFTGREYDEESGLYYYRARYYDPEQGRFVSEDPLGYSGGDPNFYGYVGNDPVNRLDPNGLIFWDVVDVVFFAWSLYDFVECPSLETGFNLLLDTISLLPGLPSAGWATRADEVLDVVNHSDDIIDGVRALDNASDAVRGLDNVDDVWDAATKPHWDEGVQRWRDPETGRFTTQPDWPPNRGFDGPPVSETLQPGTRIDRYGNEAGRYTSPEGVPFDQRSLPPNYQNTQPYNSYEVLQPVNVDSGPAAPWFGQPGGGTQFQLPSSVGELIEQGILRRIP